MYVQPEHNLELEMSMRNVPTVQGVMLSDINTYDIVNADVLVLTESAAKIFSDNEA
jgi:large subunit ribosomal protein L4